MRIEGIDVELKAVREAAERISKSLQRIDFRVWLRIFSVPSAVGLFLGASTSLIPRLIGAPPDTVSTSMLLFLLALSTVIISFSALIGHYKDIVALYRGWLTTDQCLTLFIGNTHGAFKEHLDRLHGFERLVSMKVEPYLIPYSRSADLERDATTVKCITSHLTWPSNDAVLAKIFSDIKGNPRKNYLYLVYNDGESDHNRAALLNCRKITERFAVEISELTKEDALRAETMKSQLQIKFLFNSHHGSFTSHVNKHGDEPTTPIWNEHGLKLPLFSDLVIYEALKSPLELEGTPSAQIRLGDQTELSVSGKRISVRNLMVIGAISVREVMQEPNLATAGFYDYTFMDAGQLGPVQWWFDMHWERESSPWREKIPNGS